MSDDVARVWVTKYALTTGIEESAARPHSVYPETMVLIRPGRFNQFATAKEYRLSLDDAVAQAKEMRRARIESLKRQIAKLEKMKIRVRPLANMTKLP